MHVSTLEATTVCPSARRAPQSGAAADPRDGFSRGEAPDASAKLREMARQSKAGLHCKNYRVAPGGDFRLADYSPSDLRGLPATEAEAKHELKHLLKKLDALQEQLYAEHQHKVLVVLQGMDTAGKDGTIRKVFEGVNPQGVKVASFKVPTAQEKDHDFLWRVHPHVPGKGEIAIFNRSHYEDVLVARVHNLAPKETIEHRYGEIQDFERMLHDEGTTIVKIFLNIDKDEQKRRLQDRLDQKDKNWKFSPSDLSERKLWGDYQKAYEIAIGRTSTEAAPWYVVPANNKLYRNLIVAHILVKTLEKLDIQTPKPQMDLRGVKVE